MILFYCGFLGLVLWGIWFENKRKARHLQLLETQAKQYDGIVAVKKSQPQLSMSHHHYRLTIATTNATDVRVPLTIPRPVRSVLYRGSADVRDFMHGQRVQIGNPPFDYHFLLRSTDSVFMQTFFSRPLQQQLLTLHSRLNVSRLLVKENLFHLKVWKTPETPEDYDLLRDFAIVCLDRLEEFLQIKTVFFGETIPNAFPASHLLANPDVTATSFSILAPQQLVLDGDQCAIQPLEQFLTYSLNVIGPHYLKTHVTVYCYGNCQRIPPHIRSNLQQYYKTIYEYDDKQEFLRYLARNIWKNTMMMTI